MTTLFISDLHLDASRPHITRLFVEFVRSEAVNASALYILGDLFEAWIGDDVEDETADEVADALASLHLEGVPCFFIHGNRDFLLGDAYARRARVTLLPDQSLVEIGGERILLMHGDTLCANDQDYQLFRAQSHTPTWQRRFLERSVNERSAFAALARTASQHHTRAADERIMDVSPEAVCTSLEKHQTHRMIHGHTHRPAIHMFEQNGVQNERIVLGDWYEQGSVLSADGVGFSLTERGI